VTNMGLRRVPPQSRREHVVEILREAIANGSLKPGDRLLEADLSRELGTSRAPLREALRQLEQEGLVASTPYKGSEVLGVTQAEIEHVLVPVRVTLEKFAFSQALKRMTDNDFAELQALVDDMREAAAAHSSETLAELDIRFHETVIARAEQPHCLQLWKTIQPRVWAYFRRDAPAHPDPLTVAVQHQELLDVLKTRDEEATAAAVEQHIHIYLSPEVTSDEG
jgi:DNA-binding GntR family transcriptional regulator